MNFEFRIVCRTEHPGPSYVDTSLFARNAALQIDHLLTRTWPMIPWCVTMVAPSEGIPPALDLFSGDPRFDPSRPVKINGHVYAPIAPLGPGAPRGWRPGSTFGPPGLYEDGTAALPPGWSRELRDPLKYPRQTECGPARREGDEYVCPTAGCGRRWSINEDRPECPL